MQGEGAGCGPDGYADAGLRRSLGDQEDQGRASSDQGPGADHL